MGIRVNTGTVGKKAATELLSDKRDGALPFNALTAISGDDASSAGMALTSAELQKFLNSFGDSAQASVATKADVPVAAAPTPIAGEFRVNTFTADIQQYAGVTALDGGGFVVIWSSLNQDSSGWGIYGQRYTAAGVADGGEFRVNTAIINDQLYPSTAAMNGGGFVVTWSSAQDGNSFNIYAQRYTAVGTTDGPEFLVNTSTTDTQLYSSVVTLNSGSFVVTWTSYNQDGDFGGIYGQRFTAAGVADGGEFRVNTFTANQQIFPTIAALNDGGFVITWMSEQDGSANGVYGQRYTAAGVVNGGEFRVNTFTSADQSYPSVAALGNGGFVVTWSSQGQDGDSWGIYGQRYNSAGGTDGGEFLINSLTTDLQIYSSVTSISDGGFLVTWSSNGQDGNSWGVYGQRFTAAGVADGAEFRVSETIAGSQFQDAVPLQGVTQLADGSLAATWTGNGAGDAGGIYARRFAITAPNDPPAGTDATLTITEDTARVLTIADFGFTDTDGNALLSVGITTLPTAGSITLNGTAITAGTFVTAADINAGLLVYTPGSNGNGVGYSSFTFQVRDDGGSTDTDLSANTISFDVTAANDAPVITNLQGDSVTFSEGVPNPVQIQGAIDAGLNAVVTDPDSGNFNGGSLTFAITGGLVASRDRLAIVGNGTVSLSSQNVGGVVSVNGFAIGTISAFNVGTNTQTVTFTTDDATAARVQLLIRAVQYVGDPEDPVSGTRTVSWTLNDGDGGAGTTTVTSSIVVIGVNDAPTGTDSVRTITEDQPVALTIANFGFDNHATSTTNENQSLQAVIITTVPTAGALYIDTDGAGTGSIGALVTAGQSVSAADITAGRLVYVPAANANGSAAAAFTFQVQDNGGTANGGQDTDVSPNTLTFNVTAVNDAPTVTITTAPSLGGMGMAAQWTDLESGSGELPANIWGNGATSSANRIGLTVTFGNGLTGSVIYNNVSSLWNSIFNGVAYESATGFFTAAQGLHFLFDNNSTLPMAWEDFSMAFSGNFDLDYNDQTGSHFRADAGGWNSAVFRTFTSTAAAGGASFDVTEQTASSLKGSIVLADVDAGSSVVTATLTVVYGVLNIGIGTSGATIVSGNGTGAVVVSGTIAQLNDLLGSNATSVVTYTADTDTPPSSSLFTVSVNDNGNTGTGGAQTGSASQTITITAVNDAPSGTDATLTITEDTARVMTVADFGFTDLDGNALLSVGITTLPGAGTITLNGTAVTAGTFVTAADINAGLLVYTPGSNGNGTGYSSFTFQVRDDGGSTDTDQSPNTLTFNVTAVVDAPVVANLQGDTVSFIEGGALFSAPLDVGLNALVTDADNANFNGGSLNITVTGGNAAEDFIYFDNGNPAFGLTFSGNTISQGGVAFATFDAPSANRTFTFLTDGSATPARVEQLIRSLSYFNSNGYNPTEGAHTVTYTLTDGSGGTSVTTSTVNVIAVNTAPELDLNTGTAGVDDTNGYSEGSFAAGIGTAIAISDDGNLTRATVTITDAIAGDVLTVNLPLPAGITVDPASTATNLILVGNASASTFATALGQVGYLSNSDDPTLQGTDTTRSVQVVVSDGAQDSAPATMTITVAAVNDAPVVNLAFNAPVIDQSALDLSSGHNISTFVQANNFTVSGPTTLNQFTVFLAENTVATAGTFEGFGGTLSFAIYRDNGSGLPGTLILTGSDSAPVATDTGSDLGGRDVFRFAVNLGGVTLTSGNYWLALHEGAWLSPSDGTDIFWSRSANDTNNNQRANTSNVTAPDGTFATFTPGLAFAVDGAPAATEQTSFDLKGKISVADADAGSSVVTATLSVGYGILKVNAGTSGATVISGNGTDTIVLSGTIAQLNALLRTDATSAIRYIADTDTPPGSTNLTVSVNDHGNFGSGGAQTCSAVQTITIIAVNDAPVVDLNGAGAGIDTTGSYTEGNAAIFLMPALAISDADNANLTGATVTIGTGFVSGDILRLSGGLSGTTSSGISFSYNTGTGVLTLTGSASVADYQAVLATLAFKSNSDDPGTARDITVVVNDGAASSVAAHINLTVSPVNDAPVNIVPGAQFGNIGSPIVFSTANGNAVSISDPDAGSGTMRVKLTADHGTLTLASTSGLVVTGDGTGVVRITGTLSAINAALNGLTYQSEAGYTGPDALTLTTSDLGNTGSGGPLTDTDSVAITVDVAVVQAALSDKLFADDQSSNISAAFASNDNHGGGGTGGLDSIFYPAAPGGDLMLGSAFLI